MTEHQPQPFPESMAWVLNNPVARWQARRIVSVLRVREGMRVLDVGAGSGRLTVPLARKVAPQGRVVATDLQQGMLDRLSRRARREGLTNISTRAGSAGAMQLTDDPFDLAVVASVLGEMQEADRGRALAEIHNALVPGGRLAVIESHPDPHFQPVDAVRALAEGAGFEFVRQVRVWPGVLVEFRK